MKYLLLFLISFNLFAISHTRIDELDVESRIHRLLNRLDKVCEFTIYDYTCEGGNPTSLALENELTLLKAELHVKEDARIAEKARKKDIRDRLRLIQYSKTAMRKVLKISNPAAWIRDNISKMDPSEMEAKVQEIEAMGITVKQDFDSKEQVKVNKKAQKASDCTKLKKSSAYPLYLKRLFYGKLCN